jgi:uncharacterized protein YndB with AHSA1/START domain
MGELVPRKLEWIDEAPVRIQARGESTASPAEVFAVLADHERFPEWFPMVRKVTVLGGPDGVGARRRVQIPGSSVDEEFIAWEPGARWTFTGLSAKPRFTKSLVEDCRLEPTASGGTAMTYTMYLDPTPGYGLLFKLMAAGVRKNNTKALANLGRRAATTPKP